MTVVKKQTQARVEHDDSTDGAADDGNEMMTVTTNEPVERHRCPGFDDMVGSLFRREDRSTRDDLVSGRRWHLLAWTRGSGRELLHLALARH